MSEYIETAADHAFTFFLQSLTPDRFSDDEFRMFKFYTLTKGK